MVHPSGIGVTVILTTAQLQAASSMNAASDSITLLSESRTKRNWNDG